MTRPLAGLCAGAALAAVAFLGAAPAPGHGVAGRVIDARCVVAEFRYADGEAMAFAEIRVFAPDAAGVAQAGRADEAGRFAIVADKAGRWRIEARDAEEHFAPLAFDASATPATVPPAPAVEAPPMASRRADAADWALLFGLSAALNILGGAAWLARERQTPRAPGA